MLTILELIGNTPLVEVKRLDAGPCRLFLKLETEPGRLDQGPHRAVDDRSRRKRGPHQARRPAGGGDRRQHRPRLALVAAQKGYRLLIVVPDKMSQEKIFHLKAMAPRWC